MKIIIECTTAEQTQIKRNTKINSDDTAIIYTPIYEKPEDITTGQHIIRAIDWRLTDEYIR